MHRLAFVIVAATIFAAPLAAQQHVVDPADLDRAVAEQTAQDQANRTVVLGALATPDAARAADRLGLDLQDARTAVSTLSGTELAQLANVVQADQPELSGGASTIVISTTTLLLILIIVILLAS